MGLRFDLTVPLARFYATHRAELPSVFRAIQAAPVWRAERPQKGRFRQFVQCDIDVIGEPGTLAEVELITATLDVLGKLGLEGCQVRINDRRLLTSMLKALGYDPDEHASVLITLDKLDKIGEEGVIAELADKGFETAELTEFLRRPTTMEFLPFGEAEIRKHLPNGVDPVAIAELVSIGEALGAAAESLRFDPFLVRGMGYYTGTIFEVSHPSLDYSLAGGGRYDGMIGRFLGTEVPAVGFSIGFERIVDLVELPAQSATATALIYENVEPAALITIKNELLATGMRVRLEKRPKNPKALFEQLAAEGFSQYAYVTAEGLGNFTPLTRD
jgi:histidyl-tRNA synthetase